ncbi:hypothetical protein [Arsenophonus endosymbiont of Bemisia tabaci]|uniref:hypothetical protein n=1 Tax=Arsenophonus endosymbiont of Bemisia tabaci TaxID=536059 RepID=UPI0015F74FC1|nr:hypothetical protein [Arsenophonus endosymbiont of Bemisia tabaci]
MNINGHKLNAKKSARMRNRYFVRTQYGVIKIKSLSYKSLNLNHARKQILVCFLFSNFYFFC